MFWAEGQALSKGSEAGGSLWCRAENNGRRGGSGGPRLCRGLETTFWNLDFISKVVGNKARFTFTF